VTLRCLVDGLLLRAVLRPEALVAWDGDEAFAVGKVEALFYELVAATREELLGLQAACYRLLRLAADFRHEDGDRPPEPAGGEGGGRG
jgi:hypothetical protein